MWKLISACLVISMVMGFSVHSAQPRKGRGVRGKQGQLPANVVNKGALTTEESQGLIHMRQEEKLARDVYLTLGEKWDTPIFAHIARSESRHMAAVAGLLARHDVADPVAKDVRGEFADPQLRQLYRTLVADGLKSHADAIQVGIQIEELDIADLQANLLKVRQPDIQTVYQNLLRASEQHLRAFTSQRN